MAHDQAPPSDLRGRNDTTDGANGPHVEDVGSEADPPVVHVPDESIVDGSDLPLEELPEPARVSGVDPPEAWDGPERGTRDVDPESPMPSTDAPKGAPHAPQPAPRATRSRSVVTSAAMALIAGGLAGGFVLDRTTHASTAPVHRAAEAAQAPRPSRTSQESEPAPPPKPPTLRERAIAGDADALAKLESLDPGRRTVTDALASARGRRAAELTDLELLAHDLRENPIDLEKRPDDPRVERLLQYAADRATSLRALEILASIESPAGADLLYDAWIGTRSRTETTELAEQLVFTPMVRGRASKALSVALDLRLAGEDCEAVAKLLPRASKHGDVRAARVMRRVYRRCVARVGRKDARALHRAIAKAKRRRPPKID